MRLCQPDTATDNVWHVLDVLEGSPAESAGLVPMGDWILGLPFSSLCLEYLSEPEVQAGLGVCWALKMIFMTLLMLYASSSYLSINIPNTLRL